MNDVEALSVIADAAEKDARMKVAREEEEEEPSDSGGDGGGDRSEGVVRWETFLPRMVVRVLVVEADRSTRQIITALLRKCGYAVIAVSNGLKAWETLKKKATGLDLILTEVELPAISGFALLTLIMEHDDCKNIPVIMMSSDDSISLMLKCMLKGATDFLIKPVRRNELKNLWQHVWRRHAIGKPPQNTFPQEKIKMSSQDNSTSNQPSGSVASLQKNNGCSEKLIEAQSTCTSSLLEAESAHMEKLQDESQLKSSLKLSNIDAVQHEESTKFESESTKHNDETGERSGAFVSEAASCSKTPKSTDLRIEQDHCCAETESLDDEVLRDELSKAHSNINTEIHGCSEAVVESSRGAINLIATFEDLEKPTNENWSFNGGSTTKFDFDSKLELSLRRDLPGSSSKQASEATEERQSLNHSNTSAFSWYSGSSKLLQPLLPTPSITSAKVNSTDWNSQEYHKSSGSTLDTCQYGGTSLNQENMTTLVIGHGNVFTSVIYAQSSVNPVWNLKPVCQKENSPFPTGSSSLSNPESHNSEQQNVHDKSNFDHARHHSSSAADESAGSSLCHDAANHINSIAYESVGSGSDGNATSTVVAKNNSHNFSDSGHHNYDGFRGTNSHRSSQREAALTKFRLKRKERCYQKKVRYQSRKRLAEQRPRVKGQFVRQAHHDHPVTDGGGDS